MDYQLLHRIKHFQILMLSKRGFTVPPLEQALLDKPIEESFYLFNERYIKLAGTEGIESKLDAVYTNSKNERISVIYVKSDPDKNQITSDIFTVLADRIIKADIQHVIIISRVKFTSEGYKQFNDYPHFYIEYFLYRELIYNPIDHILQPRCKLLTAGDAQRVVQNLGSQGSRVLKKFCIDDPVVKFLGASVGQIIRIDRSLDHIAESSNTRDYRIVDNTLIFEEKKPKIE